eukprot:84798-Pyramimonas_sp.AAC.1
MVADICVSLRGALACAVLIQVWLMMYFVPLQRVQKSTNVQVRRLNAIARQLQARPKDIVYTAMIPAVETYLRGDSSYRRLSDADDEVKGYGIRGASLLGRGRAHDGKPVVHLVDAHCKSRRLQVRSSHSAEALEAARNWRTAISRSSRYANTTRGCWHPLS